MLHTVIEIEAESALFLGVFHSMSCAAAGSRMQNPNVGAVITGVFPLAAAYGGGNYQVKLPIPACRELDMRMIPTEMGNTINEFGGGRYG